MTTDRRLAHTDLVLPSPSRYYDLEISVKGEDGMYEVFAAWGEVHPTGQRTQVGSAVEFVGPSEKDARACYDKAIAGKKRLGYVARG